MRSKRKGLLFVLLGVLAWWLWQDYSARTEAEKKAPVMPVAPAKPDEKKKKRPLVPRPWGTEKVGRSAQQPVEDGPGRPVEGGRTSPDGKFTLVCDLPESERKANIASKGLGCCVFRSIEYAARWQNELTLYNLPEQMVKAGIAGGGYPSKVTTILQKFGPNVQYVQDTSGDAAILEMILKSGRMACVTYNGHDCHYSGSIAHMVCLPYFDRTTGWACVEDNNFTRANQHVWMSCDEFLKRWKGSGGGWVVALLKTPPPPVPHN